MTKLAATPIYGKNPSKIFFSRTGGPIFTKLGMKHRGLQLIIVIPPQTVFVGGYTVFMCPSDRTKVRLCVRNVLLTSRIINGIS